MDFALQPHTESGKRLVALAEQHISGFAARADHYDRNNSFPHENIQALQHSGVMAACVPEDCGGLGVTSVHDTALVINRLGRGDGATAIAVNMHIFSSWLMTRAWQAATLAGNAQVAERLAQSLHQIGTGQSVRSVLVSEAGTDLLRPFVEATKTDGGWLLNGRKIFGTLSPAAHILQVACRVREPQGGVRRFVASVPRESAGLDITNNWDALGMRGSGSHDVVLTDCFVPDDALIPTGVWGEWSERFLTNNIVFTTGLVSAFLGIAEAARDLIVTTVQTRRKGDRFLAARSAIQQIIAEIEIDLAASRAMLGRTAMAVDGVFSQPPANRLPLDDLHALMKDLQCTKQFVTRKAIEIVDRALTASGGGGYLSQHPLSRLYRDVRAGPFM
jgi:alkylation response protein AidB-like acyl-CoA dehydrogenase